MIVYQNGIGATSGPRLVTCKPLVTQEPVIYVSSVSGVDSSGYGYDRETPFATLSTAIDEALEGAIIVLLADHAETISVAIGTAVSGLSLTIVGEGYDSDGYPSVRLTMGALSPTEPMLALAGARAEISNITFVPPAAAQTSNYIQSTAVLTVLRGVRLEMNGNNGAYGVTIGNSYAACVKIDDASFVSTATSASAVPYPAVSMGSDGVSPALSSVAEITNSEFDAGEYGFADASGGPYAADLRRSAVYRVSETSFLNGADVYVGTSLSGYLAVTADSGSMRVVPQAAA